MNVARKSLVAAKNIKKRETFDLQSIAVERPGTGIPPEFIDKLIGKVAKRDFKEDELIKF